MYEFFPGIVGQGKDIALNTFPPDTIPQLAGVPKSAPVCRFGETIKTESCPDIEARRP